MKKIIFFMLSAVCLSACTVQRYAAIPPVQAMAASPSPYSMIKMPLSLKKTFSVYSTARSPYRKN